MQLTIQQVKEKLCNYLKRLKKSILQSSVFIHAENFQKLTIERNFLNLIKGINKSAMANILFKDNRLSDFPPMMGNGPGYDLSPHLCIIVLKDLARTIRQEKKLYSLEKNYEL